jgi:hypothetical protein
VSDDDDIAEWGKSKWREKKLGYLRVRAAVLGTWHKPRQIEAGRCTLTPPDPYLPVAERRLVSTLAPIK